MSSARRRGSRASYPPRTSGEAARLVHVCADAKLNLVTAPQDEDGCDHSGLILRSARSARLEGWQRTHANWKSSNARYEKPGGSFGRQFVLWNPQPGLLSSQHGSKRRTDSAGALVEIAGAKKS